MRHTSACRKRTRRSPPSWTRAASLGQIGLALPPRRIDAARARRARAHPKKPTAPVSSSIPSHWLSRILTLGSSGGSRGYRRADDRRIDDARAVSLTEERLPLPLLEPGTEVGKPPAATRAGLHLLLGDETAGWEERILDRSERARKREMDDDRRQQQRGPQAARLAGPKPQENEPRDDEHDDSGPRDGRGAGNSEHKRAQHPPALPIASREVDSERDQHHERSAERNRMLRRAEHAKRSGSDSLEAAHIALIDQERHDPRKVVEDVEAPFAPRRSRTAPRRLLRTPASSPRNRPRRAGGSGSRSNRERARSSGRT